VKGRTQKKKMVKFAMIARVVDGLPLCALTDTGKTDDELIEYQKQTKNILKKMAPDSVNPLPTKATIKCGSYDYHYTIENGVCFSVLCDSTYPKILGFSYLLEIQHDFLEQFTHNEIQSTIRPYSLLSFETVLQKTKKRYVNTRTLRTPHNLAELSPKIQSLKVLDLKAVLGADYKPVNSNEMLNSVIQISISGTPEIKETPRNIPIVILSILLAFISFFRDFLPAILTKDRNFGFPSQEHLEHTHPSVIYRNISLISGILSFYLFLQAFAFGRRRTWIRFPSITYALFSLVFFLVSLYGKLMSGIPDVSLNIFLLLFSPNVLLSLVIFRSQLLARSSRSNVHND